MTQLKSFHQLLIVFALFSFLFSQGCKESLSECDRNNLGSGNGEEEPTAYCPLVYSSETPMGPSGSIFDKQKFINALEDSISSAVGYQIAVGYNGGIIGTASGGFARKKIDCIYFMSDCNIFNIASQTKSFTTAALLQLLTANNLTVDDLIWPYLPSDWVLPAYVKKLSFRHCLGHRTAVPGTNSDGKSTTNFAGLKLSFTSDAVDSLVVDSNPDNNKYRYLNADLAIMRLIIPALWKNLPDADNELKSAPAITDALSKKYYEKYMKTKVFEPVGVVDAEQKAPGGKDNTLHYFSSGNNAGAAFETDWTTHGGGGGWFMRASDIVKIIMGMWENDEVLSPENRIIMMDHPTLGWKQGFTTERNTTRGRAFSHGGDLGASDGEQVHGAFAILPDGIYVNMMVNSNIPGYNKANSTTLFRIICNAYNEAW
jgi:CubicO group peptidase (beta-lactamase class C family)